VLGGVGGQNVVLGAYHIPLGCGCRVLPVRVILVRVGGYPGVGYGRLALGVSACGPDGGAFLSLCGNTLSRFGRAVCAGGVAAGHWM